MTDWFEITRRNARSVQTTIGWIFWDPGAVERYVDAGMPEALAAPFGYIGARCAPLAGAGPEAVVAAFGWPANREKDAVYPYADVDAEGKPLTGAGQYTLTFPKGQTPPVDGFWSITMYEIDQGWWFVPNPLNKFTVSPRNDPKYNADGSLTLYFQNESPGKDKEANWLPAPKGPFIVMLRMYGPKEKDPSILDGSWKPPAVKKAG